MLHLTALTHQYGRQTVLDDLTLALEPGSLNVLGGSNGTGKSTLLRLLAGIERPTRGRIAWHGATPPPSAIGYLPQDLGFHPLLTVTQILRFYAEVRQLPETASRAALVRWGLETHAAKRTRELSGGLRQRLGLAILGLGRFRLLLLDEPDLSLDPAWREALREWLAGAKGTDAVIVVTTHLTSEWESVADRLWQCEDGRLRGARARAPARPETDWREGTGR